VDAGDLVRHLWELIEGRRWPEAGALLADDLAIDWPHTGEKIRGRDDYIAINAHYPEGWRIEILQVVATGEQVAIEVRVPHESLGISYLAAFYVVIEGQIRRGTEYWVDERSQPAPGWRRQWTER
jgi:SnoaL-like domain